MNFYDLMLAESIGGSGGGGGSATLIEKSISANGVYKASDDSADGYSKATVDVPNSYAAGDEGKVVSNGALVSQSSATYDQNGTYDTTLKNSVTVNVSGGGGTSPFTLLNTITVSENVRAVNVDISPYTSSYDFILLYEDVTLSSADWLYYARNGSAAGDTGTYSAGQHINHQGIALWKNKSPGNGVFYGIISSNNSIGYNGYSSVNNVYIYTYTASKTIKAGSVFKIYGGNYANM